MLITLLTATYQSRRVVVVDGLPFYQSTGMNSKYPMIWFPFLGITMDKRDIPHLPSALVAKNLKGTLNHTEAKWIVKANAPFKMLLQPAHQLAYTFDSALLAHSEEARLSALKAMVEKQGLKDGFLLGGIPESDKAYVRTTVYVLRHGKICFLPIPVVMPAADCPPIHRDDAQTLRPVFKQASVMRLFGAILFYQPTGLEARLTSEKAAYTAIKLNPDTKVFDEAFEAAHPGVLEAAHYTATEYAYKPSKIVFNDLGVSATLPEFNAWIKQQGGYLFNLDAFEYLEAVTGWDYLHLSALHHTQVVAPIHPKESFSAYDATRIAERYIVDLKQLQTCYQDAIATGVDDLKSFLCNADTPQPIPNYLKGFLLYESSAACQDFCERIPDIIRRVSMQIETPSPTHRMRP